MREGLELVVRVALARGDRDGVVLADPRSGCRVPHDSVVSHADAVRELIHGGVTTFETKSGYGLTVADGTASLPVTLSLFAAHARDDVLSASVATDTTDLSIVKLLVPTTSLPAVSGRLAAKVSATGTWNHPVFEGNVDMINGSANDSYCAASTRNTNTMPSAKISAAAPPLSICSSEMPLHS